MADDPNDRTDLSIDPEDLKREIQKDLRRQRVERVEPTKPNPPAKEKATIRELQGLPGSRPLPKGIRPTQPPPAQATEVFAPNADDAAGSSRFFDRIPAADRELIRELGQEIDFGFGQIIVREGDAADGLYVLVEGRARVVKRAGNAQESVLAMLGPGDVFGEIAAKGTPRSATVRASSAVKVLRLDADELDKLLHNRPQLRGWLAGYKESRTLATLIRSQSPFGKLPDRVFESLLDALVPVSMTAGQRVFGEGDELGPLYLVKSGRLRVSKLQPDGRDIPIAFLKEGSIFGAASNLERTPRQATVEAITDVQLLALAPKPVRALVGSSADFKLVLDEHNGSIDFEREASMPLDIAEAVKLADKRKADAALVAPPSLAAAANAAELRPSTSSISESKGPKPGSVNAATDEAPFKSSDGYFIKREGRRRKFPLILQVDEMDCGVACLAMITRFYGKRISLGRIRSLTFASTDGTSLQALCRAAQELGLAARSTRASKGNLDKLPTPAIVHWQNYHWVVLTDVRGDKIRIADPAIGDRIMTRAEFLENWNGHAALFDFTEAFNENIDDKHTLAWMWPYFRPYLGVFTLAVFLAFVVAMLTMLIPVLSQVVVDRVVVDGAKDLLNVILLTMGVTFLCVTVARALQSYLLAFAAVRVDAALLDYLTRRLLALPMKYFSARRTGDIQRRIEGAQHLRAMFVSSGVSGVLAVVQLMVALGLMLVYSPTLTTVFLGLTPLYFGLMMISARLLKPLFGQLEESFGKYNSDQLDAIKGMESVKAASAEAAFRDALLDRFLKTSKQQFRADFAILTYEGLLQATGYLSNIMFLMVAANLAIKGELTLGGFVAFNSLVAMANQPIFTVLALWDQLQRGQVLVNRLADVFETEPEQGRQRDQLIPVRTLSGAVELRGIGFRYGGPEGSPILKNIDLKVQPGEMIAFVGRSGSGKTTLVKVMCGLLEPTEGSILFDGVDAKMLNGRDLRRRIGFVLQENHMFSGSILENIAFGEEPDLERAQAAARAADAHGFIEKLPLGYGTVVGESGIRLSGGQAQRVAISRALYKQPTMLIFDEATSALDTESERAIQNNMGSYFKGRTAFVIAHRLSTVRDANRIVVLEKGEIVEMGSHDQLMKKRGLYYELASKQVDQ